jgi:hypothetical protein
MRIRLERSGTVFEYERPPMPEHRFKALCLLAAGGLYVGLVAAVAALCGGWGVLMVAVVTLVVVMTASA